ncbi:MAG: asparagine synthase (glutamine-hydrolyzing) [Candidatus Auribacterota bacterium]|jgi:asparagine synthase (glutamine-hydrolysing)|nr:asparagine synthase (glutamine-hydrolyzing) [Candidatus Auribacterota bacterium]
MCGITGIFHIDGKPVNRNVLAEMNSTMSHRGPDESGFFIDNFFGLGHRRLSIIDLSTGKQPMCNEDESIWIAFNGEIFNFMELKHQLESNGHRFKTNSDTEVIIHLYEQYGDRSVEKLQGMFAFALWDKNQQKLFIARDRIGIKPLYYFFDGRVFLFGSEIKPILAYGKNIPLDMDYQAIHDYLTFGFIPGEKSIFKHIRKLESAHTLSISKSLPVPKITEYWDISFADKTDVTEHQLIEQILEHLKNTVQSHLISDVPLGSFLSGGIDSSAVAAMMATIVKDPIKTCSIGFDHQNFSELPYAREVAKLYKTDHSEYIVTPDALNILDTILYYYDEPFADTSALPSYYLSKMTREKVTVALSGDGGDENFAGYRRYIFDLFENRVRAIMPKFVRKPFFSMLGAVYPKADWLPQVFRAKTTFQNLALDPFDAYFSSVSVYPEIFLKKILNRDFLASLDGYSSQGIMKKYFEKADSDHPLDKIIYTEIKTLLPDDYLVKVDRASMANSLEVRVPLLDHKFMEFAATIPAEKKLNGFSTKYIFKKALKKFLPDTILYRKKQGFEMPIDGWIRKELKNPFHDVLFADNSFISNIIDKTYLEKIWQQHQSGVKLYGNNLWLIFILESWHKKYISK